MTNFTLVLLCSKLMSGAEEKMPSLPEPDVEQRGSGSGSSRSARWVGKYRLISELGRGGMASVYLAVARGIGGVNKLVVLKAVLPELASEPSSLAMFMDEARLAAQLNHPNVVQTYEVGTEGDRHVIVMEYLEGQTLRAPGAGWRTRQARRSISRSTCAS